MIASVTLCMKKKIIAWRFRKKLVRSLCLDTDWKQDHDKDMTLTSYKRGKYVVCVQRSPLPVLRVLDRVYVIHHGQDIWLPLLARLRVRCAIRLRALAEANAAFEESSEVE